MKTLPAIILTVMVGMGSAMLAQNIPTGAHPAAGDPHPAAVDSHPAKADVHPAASTEIHPAFPNHPSDTNTNTTNSVVSPPEAISTNSLNGTTPTPVENFSIPTFVPTPPSADGTSSATVVTNQAAATLPTPATVPAPAAAP